MGFKELFLVFVVLSGLGLMTCAIIWPGAVKNRFPVIVANIVLACVLALIAFWGLD